MGDHPVVESRARDNAMVADTSVLQLHVWQPVNSGAPGVDLKCSGAHPGCPCRSACTARTAVW